MQFCKSASASGVLSPKLPTGLCPWTPLGDSRLPDPCFAAPTLDCCRRLWVNPSSNKQTPGFTPGIYAQAQRIKLLILQWTVLVVLGWEPSFTFTVGRKRLEYKQSNTHDSLSNSRPGPVLRNFSGCTISKVHVWCNALTLSKVTTSRANKLKTTLFVN